MWLVGVGGIYGRGCKEVHVYRFPHTTYPYSSCTYLFFFAAASLLFVHLKKCFSFLFQYFFVIKIYVLNNFLAQYKHIRATTCVTRQPYEGCT